jgi:hypothetical protein
VIRNRYGTVTTIWPDLTAGMTIEWAEEPWQLDVVAVGLPDAERWCRIDAVQGRFRACADDMFTEITPELADIIGSVVIDENERLS